MTDACITIPSFLMVEMGGGLSNFLPELTSNLSPSDLSLQSS
jgi:hypothetical protein